MGGYGSFGLPYMTPGAVIANSLDEHQQRKQRLSDMERQTRFDQYSQDIAGIQSNLGKMTPGSPEYIDLAGKLKQAQADRVSLFHPDTQGLDGIRHLIRLIRGKGSAPAVAPGGTPNFSTGPGDTGSPMSEQIPAVGGTPTSPGPLTPAQAKQQMADRAAGFTLAATPQQQNPFLVEAKQLKDAGFSDEQIQKVQQIRVGLEAKAVPEKPDKYQGQLTTTTDAQGKQHYWRVPLAPGADPEEVDFNGQKVDPKNSSVPKVGSFGDFMIQAYGVHPTAEQYADGNKRWAESKAGATVGEHVVLVPQPDGSIKAIVVQTTSAKTFGGGAAAPADLKKKAAANLPPNMKPAAPTAPPKPRGAGVVGGGDVVGGKLTAPQEKAQTDYQEAFKLAKMADQVAQKPDDAVNQKRLAVALERASAGRFTTQALDYIIRAGLGNTIEGWANSVTTGALPADVLRQLVDGAHQNLKAADAARIDAGVPGANNAAPPANQPQQASGKAVSLAAARKLPINQGKSDEQIKADIIAHHHTVTD